MNRNFAMTVLQTGSHARAEANPPPCVNTTNKLQPFGHRRGKKHRRSRYDSRSSLSQCCRCWGPSSENGRGDRTAIELFSAGVPDWEARLQRVLFREPAGEW